MIKAIGTKGNQTLVLLGLSRRNCELLLEGKPIHVDVEKLVPGLRVSVLLIAGETELAITKEMADTGMIDGNTLTHLYKPEGGADAV
ncbi:MAG TPA: hypothetical protein VG269_26695 [Tepidisphaeraceae bacterium]|jgi:hypothetical protein|nr:hypothetical protein [Tepidisphaeraceae bacterium]